MAKLTSLPTVITPVRLSILLKDFITEYYPKISYMAVKFKDDNVYFLTHNDMSPAYEISLRTREVRAVSEKFEKYEALLNKYFKEMYHETIDSMFEQLIHLRKKFPDMVL